MNDTKSRLNYSWIGVLLLLSRTLNAGLDSNGWGVKLLLDEGVGIAIEDDSQRMTLHWERLGGHEFVVMLILENGADASAQTDRIALRSISRMRKDHQSSARKRIRYRREKAALHVAAYQGD